MFSTPNIPESLEAALSTENPRGALQRLVNVWLDQGAERGDLLPALEAFREQLQSAGRAEAADLIAELMEGFDGWCRIP